MMVNSTQSDVSLYLPTRAKLWCTIQLREQIHSSISPLPYMCSVVYSPADRAETLSLSPLSPFMSLRQMLGWTCESVQRKFCPVLQYSLQREERQREEEKVRLGPSTLIFGWRGRIWIRRCCYVLARCLGHETKMFFPCYGIFSAI